MTKYQILMHKDLAAKHGWKVGDKVKLDSNIYDADNEKGAKETVEVTIKGLFDGHNKSAVTYSQELYEKYSYHRYSHSCPTLWLYRRYSYLWRCYLSL